MALKFNNQWRFQPPEDGRFINKELPPGAVDDLLALASKVATQGNRKQVLEHFKSFTAHVSGRTHTSSSDVGWAESDLASNVKYGAENAPLLIEAFYDACKSLTQQNPDW